MGLFDNLVNNVANAAVQTVQDAAQPYVDTANQYLNQANDALSNLAYDAQNAMNDLTQGLENFQLPALPDVNQLVNTGIQTGLNVLYQPGQQVPQNALPGVNTAQTPAVKKNVATAQLPAQTQQQDTGFDIGRFIQDNGTMIMLGIAGVVVLMMATA